MIGEDRIVYGRSGGIVCDWSIEERKGEDRM
jgi:hypothetical protein